MGSRTTPHPLPRLSLICTLFMCCLPLPPVRCKVRAYDHASHTFYLLNQDGSLPSRQYVQMACQVRRAMVTRAQQHPPTASKAACGLGWLAPDKGLLWVHAQAQYKVL